MNNLITWLEGRKTYAFAIALYFYAIGGAVTGHLSVTDAVGIILSSGGLAALRAAIAQVEGYLPMLVQIWEFIQQWEPVTPAVPTPVVPPPPATITQNGFTY